MYIVFLILKILAAILIALAVILLCMIVYLLFAPVGYRADAAADEDISLSFDVFDFFRLLKASVLYNKGDISYSIKALFGLIKLRSGEEASPDPIAGEEGTESDTSFEEISEYSITDDGSDKKKQPDKHEEAVFDTDFESKADNRSIRDDVIKASDSLEADYIEPIEPDYDITEPSDITSDGGSSTDDREPGRIEKILNLINDNSSKRAASVLLAGGLNILKRVMPHIRHADITFSTGEPDTTGQLIGAAAVFPVMYSRGVKVSGDFSSERAYINGDLSLQGSIALCHVAMFLLRVVANRDCRRLYKRVRSI